MPNRPGNDDRNAALGSSTGVGGSIDRGGQRDISGNNQQSGTQGGFSGASSQGGGSARTRSNRGFASMDREKQKEIASKGGKAAHAKGTAHEFDSTEAREAGRKGGVAVSRNREHMAAIGRRGGEARGHSRNRSNAQTNTAGVGSTEGAYQNSRNVGGNVADRQVGLNNQNEGLGTQGNRGGNNSLGGERRANSPLGGNESFGNH